MLDISKIYTSTKCGDFKVISYNSASSVEVEFFNTGYVCISKSVNIRRGQVNDKLNPSVFGVGFVGIGNSKPSIDGVHTKEYKAWSNMISRCYSPNTQEINPTYKGCSVCNEWLDFQIFAKWFGDNYIYGYQLDKDIKIKGNKVYSPSTCKFVSPKDNIIQAHARRYVFISPEGLTVEVYNLTEFCKNKKLTHKIMSMVHSGKSREHKGWTKA